MVYNAGGTSVATRWYAWLVQATATRWVVESVNCQLAFDGRIGGRGGRVGGRRVGGKGGAVLRQLGPTRPIDLDVAQVSGQLGGGRSTSAGPPNGHRIDRNLRGGWRQRGRRWIRRQSGGSRPLGPRHGVPGTRGVEGEGDDRDQHQGDRQRLRHRDDRAGAPATGRRLLCWRTVRFRRDFCRMGRHDGRRTARLDPAVSVPVPEAGGVGNVSVPTDRSLLRRVLGRGGGIGSWRRVQVGQKRQLRRWQRGLKDRMAVAHPGRRVSCLEVAGGKCT